MSASEIKIEIITRAIDSAFMDPDLYFREMFSGELMKLKWYRAALLQGSAL